MPSSIHNCGDREESVATQWLCKHVYTVTKLRDIRNRYSRNNRKTVKGGVLCWVQSTMLIVVTRQQPVKTNREDIMRVTVNYKECKLAIALYLIIVTVYKSPINAVHNQNPVSSHKYVTILIKYPREIIHLVLCTQTITS
jgi:hypothetical protein